MLLAVPRSSFYAWRRQMATETVRIVRKALKAVRVDSDEDLRAAVDEVVGRLRSKGRQREQRGLAGSGAKYPTSPELDPSTERWWSWWGRDVLDGEADAPSNETVTSLRSK